MNHSRNPFEYDAAPNLEPDLLIDWFIEDHNYSRFIQSTRNVLINGQRGSGKSMALIFNSIPYQRKRLDREGGSLQFNHAGIYIPCNTPLTHKQEYKLLPDVEQAILSEHFFSYGIGAAIAKDFKHIEADLSTKDKKQLLDEFEYLTRRKSEQGAESPFSFLQRSVRDLLRADQENLGKGLDISLQFETGTFYTFILPIISAIKETEFFKNSHISLLIDDAHDLNSHQKSVLNSWIGYREHSLFSFKVAIAGVRHYDFQTSFGGTILEGHDFITIDLDQPFQNDESDYGKFAREVVQKRLSKIGVSATADEFFPESADFNAEIEKFCDVAEKEAIEKGVSDKKSISNHRYKYGRALYFRSRDPKANRPQYAGFDTLAHVSTGVIRNLLEPCYWMYEQMLSGGTSLVKIPPHVQSEVILSRSDNLWDFIRSNLDKRITGCSKSDASKLERFFTALCEHFRERLLKHKSEPRVISFSISAYSEDVRAELAPLLFLAEKAQLLYVRSGPKKKSGGREDYYILNRMLLPAYGLDVNGQHGRASIKAVVLLDAANGKKIPFEALDDSLDVVQGELF